MVNHGEICKSQPKISVFLQWSTKYLSPKRMEFHHGDTMILSSAHETGERKWLGENWWHIPGIYQVYTRYTIYFDGWFKWANSFQWMNSMSITLKNHQLWHLHGNPARAWTDAAVQHPPWLQRPCTPRRSSSREPRRGVQDPNMEVSEVMGVSKNG